MEACTDFRFPLFARRNPFSRWSRDVLANWRNERSTEELCCTAHLAGKVATHYYPPQPLIDMNSAEKKKGRGGIIATVISVGFFLWITSKNHTDHCFCRLCSVQILETLWMPLFTQTSSTELLSAPPHAVLYHTPCCVMGFTFCNPLPWKGHWDTCKETLNNCQLNFILQTRFFIKTTASVIRHHKQCNFFISSFWFC